MTLTTSPRWLEQIKASRATGRSLFCLPLARVALSTPARELILADVRKWCEYAPLPGMPEGAAAVTAYIADSRAFRTLLYYRLSHCSFAPVKLVLPLLRAIWRPHATLLLNPDSLGPGCFIMHGDASMVIAKSIGENFVLAQHVLLGYRRAHEYPTIGDDVTIYVGAIIIGDITVGDRATIGAGAVVANDVPSGTTVVGLPARPVPIPVR